MQYRPFWYRLFDPRLTGGIIVIALLLALQAFANLFALGSLIASQQNMDNAPLHALGAALYGLAAFGLLKVNRKARFLSIAIAIFSVFQGAILMLYVDLFQGMLTVVIYGLAGVHLLSAKCRAVFYPPQEGEDKKDQG